MGFDVTAANVIFFIAVLSVGSVALGAYWKNADHIEDARRIEDKRADERAHTNMTVTSASYNGGPDRFTVQIKNTGSTVIDLSEMTYVVDGVYVASASIEQLDVVDEPTTTDLLLPLETMELWLRPITSSPTTFQVVSANGATANWRA